jgi:hypothetical protein
MMNELHKPPSDEPCPIADQLLGEMYRASPYGLSELVATVSPDLRAQLALYCFRRAHLTSIGLVIAASCERDVLTAIGGNAGAMLFERSREAAAPRPPLAQVGGRRISLSSAPLCGSTPMDEQED